MYMAEIDVTGWHLSTQIFKNIYYRWIFMESWVFWHRCNIYAGPLPFVWCSQTFFYLIKLGLWQITSNSSNCQHQRPTGCIIGYGMYTYSAKTSWLVNDSLRRKTHSLLPLTGTVGKHYHIACMEYHDMVSPTFPKLAISSFKGKFWLVLYTHPALK